MCIGKARGTVSQPQQCAHRTAREILCDAEWFICRKNLAQPCTTIRAKRACCRVFFVFFCCLLLASSALRVACSRNLNSHTSKPCGPAIDHRVYSVWCAYVHIFQSQRDLLNGTGYTMKNDRCVHSCAHIIHYSPLESESERERKTRAGSDSSSRNTCVLYTRICIIIYA